jgi:hypothetical protein
MRFAATRFLGILASFVPGVLAAQGGVSPSCPGGTPSQRFVQDACQKAVDLFEFMVPQAGLALAGGGAVLGEGSSLGRLGSVSIGLRGNLIQGDLPRVEDAPPSTGGAVASTYSLAGTYLGAPVLDVAAGVFPGVSFPGTRALALDALVNVAWIPEYAGEGVRLSTPEGGVRLGYGARLTLLDESIVTPALAVTFVRRDLPRVDLIGETGDDRLEASGLELRTSALRFQVAKRLGLVTVSAGAGSDKIEAAATVRAWVRDGGVTQQAGPVQLERSLRRDNVFAGVGLNLKFAVIGAEVGRSSGGTIETFNSFGGTRADAARVYGSAGLRLRW